MAEPLVIEAPAAKLTFAQTFATLPRSFWMCCTMEMWERLAFYGVRMVMPIYIAQADEPGGLHFSQIQKGGIYSIWALVQPVCRYSTTLGKSPQTDSSLRISVPMVCVSS